MTRCCSARRTCNELSNSRHRCRNGDLAVARAGRIVRNDELHSALTDQIRQCLDFSEIPDYVRNQRSGEAAACLKEILDRIDLPAERDIPGKEELAEATAAGQPLKRWKIPGTDISIVRVAEGPKTGAFLFSAGTIRRAPMLYQRIKKHPYKPGASEGLYRWFLCDPGPKMAPLVRLLPKSLRIGGEGRHAPWQWVA